MTKDDLNHIRRNLTTNIEGLLRRIEKEDQPGFLVDLIHEIQKICYTGIKDLFLFMSNNKKSSKSKRDRVAPDK